METIYQINLVPEPEGGYTVLVPALSGCVSYGETIEEATRNAKEAIELHLECLAAHQTKKFKLDRKHSKQFFTTLININSPYAKVASA